MKFKLVISFIIIFNFLYSYTGSTARYGYSARSFALSDAMVADEYRTFQSFSNPSSLTESEAVIIEVVFLSFS